MISWLTGLPPIIIIIYCRLFFFYKSLFFQNKISYLNYEMCYQTFNSFLLAIYFRIKWRTGKIFLTLSFRIIKNISLPPFGSLCCTIWRLHWENDGCPSRQVPFSFHSILQCFYQNQILIDFFLNIAPFHVSHKLLIYRLISRIISKIY